MDAITMGQRHNTDDPVLALVAGVIRQAAFDYKYSIEWLARNEGKRHTKEYDNVDNLRKDVIRFVHGDLFDYAIGNTVSPDEFLDMALDSGKIKSNRPA